MMNTKQDFNEKALTIAIFVAMCFAFTLGIFVGKGG
jgi:hypothetical protein